jgi:acetylglutamate/LysW-gamma-L-alpha-aminoadipate kinase
VLTPEVAGVIVVKCSGSGIDRQAVCDDVARLRARGEPVVLVHGGGSEIDELLGALGHEPEYYTSPSGVTSRRSTAPVVDAMTMALTGRVKPSFLRHLLACDVPAVGLTGIDGGLLRARRKPAVRAVVGGRRLSLRDELSGRITRVDGGLLRSLLRVGITPVLSPPALDEHGEVVNVNADRVAAAVAVALGARALVFLASVAGVLADVRVPASLLPVVTLGGPRVAMPGSGGMTAKLLACREALEGGVGEVRVACGENRSPVLAALAGGGTSMVLQGETASVEGVDGHG